jgi:hypothetical protein
MQQILTQALYYFFIVFYFLRSPLILCISLTLLVLCFLRLILIYLNNSCC